MLPKLTQKNPGAELYNTQIVMDDTKIGID